MGPIFIDEAPNHTEKCAANPESVKKFLSKAELPPE